VDFLELVFVVVTADEIAGEGFVGRAEEGEVAEPLKRVFGEDRSEEETVMERSERG
jgi:hypothetical protein